MKFIFLMLFISCASLNQNRYATESIRKLVVQYEELKGSKINSNITFSIEPLESDTALAVCNTAFKSIKISDRFYFSSTDEELMLVVFHELGHCDLGRKHSNVLFYDKCAKSLMHWNARYSDRTCWVRYKEHYLKELFN